MAWGSLPRLFLAAVSCFWRDLTWLSRNWELVVEEKAKAEEEGSLFLMWRGRTTSLPWRRVKSSVRSVPSLRRTKKVLAAWASVLILLQGGKGPGFLLPNERFAGWRCTVELTRGFNSSVVGQATAVGGTGISENRLLEAWSLPFPVETRQGEWIRVLERRPRKSRVVWKKVCLQTSLPKTK